MASACSSDTHATGVPWEDQRTQVIDAQGDATRVAPVSGTQCVQFQNACLKPAATCGSSAADILLDASGAQAGIVCYPDDATLSVEHLQGDNGQIAQTQNNTVVVFDHLNDGADVTGDVSIDANNVVLYGDSAASAVLAGALTLDGNNAFVRGVRIQGDVTIDKNDATLALCVIEGDLVIHGNNAKVLGCDVLGKITVEGNNTVLSANHVVGDIKVSGKNTTCTDNAPAKDTNGDHTLEPSELGVAQDGC